MKGLKKWISLCCFLIVGVLIFNVPASSQTTRPDLENIRQRNVALMLEGFIFGSGLSLNQQGEPNCNGLEILTGARWSGSGFLVRNDGTIITNYHVARRALGGIAQFDDQSIYQFSQIRVYDPINDLAILKLSAQRTFPTVLLGDSDNVKPMDEVIAVGNPQGSGINVTRGEVSQVRKDNNNKPAFIVHTAQIAPGSSGGALYKERDVIGINVSMAMLRQFQAPSGFFFAIPINNAKRLIQNTNLFSLENVFPTNVQAILNKWRELDAATGQAPAKSGEDPGVYSFTYELLPLQDYLIVIESPGRDLVLKIDSPRGCIGLGDQRIVDFEGVFISSENREQIRISILNYDETVANFGLKIGMIIW